MLDFTLAELYKVETRTLNQAVKRNKERFPKDFMFRLTITEWKNLRTQNAVMNSSQIVMSSKKHRGRKYLPYAFTEQGVAMLSGVLSSKQAIDVNISIMRAFVLIRQYYLDYKEFKFQIKKLEKEMNRKFKDIYDALHYLLHPPHPERKAIGFRK
jgi:hypothetical protein